MSEKTTVGGDVYEVKNLWDATAFFLIDSWQTIVGGVKKVASEVVSVVVEPLSGAVKDVGEGIGSGLKGVGKGLTSWIPILLVVGAIAAVVYFFILRKKP
jgi:hypothetical protein